MKKLLCVLLAVLTLMSFTACGEETKTDKGTSNTSSTGTSDIPTTVTIYIPDTITIYQSDTLYATVTYVFEEGWQNKDAFTVTMGGDTDKLGGSGTIVYSDKKLTQEVSNGATMETYYNDQGQQIKMVNLYASGGYREVTYTYDSMGRLVSEEVKMYDTADSEAVVTTTDYTYTDTADGYTTTQEVNGHTMVSAYNKDGFQISQVTYRNGEEMSRTEVSYDEAGNMVSNVTYYNGQKQMEMKYTWKTVEVSSEVAARLPQFRKGN